VNYSYWFALMLGAFMLAVIAGSYVVALLVEWLIDYLRRRGRR
jgi:hypothetical protein